MNICFALICYMQVHSLGSGSFTAVILNGGGGREEGDFNSRGDIGNVWIDFSLSLVRVLGVSSG